MFMSIDNSEIDIVPCRQGFIGISTTQNFSERGPVQVTEEREREREGERERDQKKINVLIKGGTWTDKTKNKLK